MTREEARLKIIFALDVETLDQAERWADLLAPHVGMFKIGKQLFTACGPAVVQAIRERGGEVFLDLKYHDIPNTVARAVESANALGVHMVTIHLTGGSEMIRAAMGARANDMWILGVTVLTSATEETLREIGVSNKLDDQVLRLARLGVTAGIDGLVASPHEIKRLRAEFGDKIKIAVQGIRPSWADPDDQKRFMTPRQALEAGADYIGIGRPITRHPNPHDAVAKILHELA